MSTQRSQWILPIVLGAGLLIVVVGLLMSGVLRQLAGGLNKGTDVNADAPTDIATGVKDAGAKDAGPKVLWNVAVPVSKPPAVPTEASTRTIPITEASAFLSAPNAHNLLAVSDNDGSNAQLFDFTKPQPTKWLPTFKFDPKNSVLSPDGKRLAEWKERRTGPPERIVSISDPVTGRELSRIVISWHGIMEWAAFAPGDLLLTCIDMPAAPAQLEAWSIKDGRLVWSTSIFDTMSERTWTLDPSGTYLAMIDPDEKNSKDPQARLLVFETRTGELAGTASAGLPGYGRLGPEAAGVAFSADGKRIAAVVPTNQIILLQWESATGKRLDDMAVVDLNPGAFIAPSLEKRKIEFLNNQYVFVGGQYLVDLTTGNWIYKVPAVQMQQQRVPLRAVDGQHTLTQSATEVRLQTLDTKTLAAARTVRTKEVSPTDQGLPALRPAIVAGARQLNDKSDKWSAAPDPGPNQPLYRQSVQLPPGQRWDGNLLIARGGSGRALLTSENGSTPAKAALLDLVGTAPARLLEIPTGPTTRFRAIDSAGKRVATITNSERVDVFDIDTGAQVAGFKVPRGKDVGPAYDAAFADADHLIVVGSAGMSFWKLADASIVWQRAGSYGRCKATPGGKYLVASGSNGLQFIDMATGAEAGRLADSQSSGMSWSFSPDGTTLVAAKTDGIAFWDLKSGQITRSFPLQLYMQNGDPQWLDDQCLLLGDYLLSIPAEHVFWRFNGMHAKTLHGTSGGTFWYTVPDAPGGGDKLHAVQIPAEAKLAASKAKKSEPLVGRGMTVSITGEVGEAAKRQLVNRLTQAGINVADGAPIRLVTSITIKDHGRQEYTFKKSRQKQTVQVTSTTRRIAWERSDGKVLWESTSTLKTDDQFGTNLPEGKPLQELLDKPQLEARTKPFDTDEVPVPLLLDRNTTTVGWTRMASDGPQPGER